MPTKPIKRNYLYLQKKNKMLFIRYIIITTYATL
ncbi:hypothetical protein TF3313_0255 [Tannerella forsythia 3313]|nr:hypothetical protein TF3313_0255 [Tannerella forsythia 3313]